MVYEIDSILRILQCNNVIFWHMMKKSLSSCVWSFSPFMSNITRVLNVREMMGQKGLQW